MAAGVPVAAQALEGRLRPFATILGEATWRRALVLVAGALLAPGRRTVASALRAAGLGGAPGFAGYHRVLSHARWSGLAASRRLLALLVAGGSLRAGRGAGRRQRHGADLVQRLPGLARGPEVGNGAFTEAVLEALGGEADENKDGLLGATELARYVDRRVRALTGGRQSPAMEVRSDGTLFAIR